MNTDKSNGGPAFPTAFLSQGPHEYGMSLRDWFAGMALSAIRSRTPRVFDYEKPANGYRVMTAQEAARYAYEDADAMLAERDKQA